MFRLFPEPINGPGAVGLLLVRLVVGLAFILHGWPKIQSPLAWMGPDAQMPGFLQACAAVAEFGGGIALLLGVLTPLAALGLAITMAVATFMVHVPMQHSFVGKPGEPSFELSAVYLVVAIMFLLVGPGVFSLDALLFQRRRQA